MSQTTVIAVKMVHFGGQLAKNKFGGRPPRWLCADMKDATKYEMRTEWSSNNARQKYFFTLPLSASKK